MIHLSTGPGAGCWATPDLVMDSQCRPWEWWPTAPFISCFQNDISLATEDQQARQEQKSLVSPPQTNPRTENMPRSRQAETDRATMDPPLTSA